MSSQASRNQLPGFPHPLLQREPKYGSRPSSGAGDTATGAIYDAQNLPARLSSPGRNPTPLPSAREYEGGHDSASRTHQSLLSGRRLRAAAPRRRGEGPQAPSFGAAGAHVRAAGAWRTPRPLSSHRAVGATIPCLGLRSQVPPPSSAGSAVSTETSFPLPHSPHAAP